MLVDSPQAFPQAKYTSQLERHNSFQSCLVLSHTLAQTKCPHLGNLTQKQQLARLDVLHADTACHTHSSSMQHVASHMLQDQHCAH